MSLDRRMDLYGKIVYSLEFYIGVNYCMLIRGIVNGILWDVIESKVY